MESAAWSQNRLAHGFFFSLQLRVSKYLLRVTRIDTLLVLVRLSINKCLSAAHVPWQPQLGLSICKTPDAEVDEDRCLSSNEIYEMRVHTHLTEEPTE